MTHTMKMKTGRTVLLFLLLFLTGCDFSPRGQEIDQTEDIFMEEETDTQMDVSREEEKTIWVHVCGQVNQPGVYSFPEGSRVFDAVEAAGGFTKEADQNSVNLAMTLSDEGKVYIGAKGEWENQSEKAGMSSDGLVNLNTATLEDLMSLPGIGEKRAESILKLRDQRGGFQKVEELLEAEGIQEGIFEKIKDFVKV